MNATTPNFRLNLMTGLKTTAQFKFPYHPDFEISETTTGVNIRPKYEHRGCEGFSCIRLPWIDDYLTFLYERNPEVTFTIVFYQIGLGNDKGKLTQSIGIFKGGKLRDVTFRPIDDKEDMTLLAKTNPTELDDIWVEHGFTQEAFNKRDERLASTSVGGKRYKAVSRIQEIHKGILEYSF